MTCWCYLLLCSDTPRYRARRRGLSAVLLLIPPRRAQRALGHEPPAHGLAHGRALVVRDDLGRLRGQGRRLREEELAEKKRGRARGEPSEPRHPTGAGLMNSVEQKLPRSCRMHLPPREQKGGCMDPVGCDNDEPTSPKHAGTESAQSIPTFQVSIDTEPTSAMAASSGETGLSACPARGRPSMRARGRPAST